MGSVGISFGPSTGRSLQVKGWGSYHTCFKSFLQPFWRATVSFPCHTHPVMLVGLAHLSFPSKGFWLRRGAEWVESNSSQDHNQVGLSQIQRVPGTGVRKVVWPQYTLQGPMVPSAGCLDIHHYVQAGSSCQQPCYQLRGKSEV